MEILFAIILGLVQGLTEFLPVSSSGHLSIVNQILEFFGKTPYDPDSGEHLLMTVVLHGATAFATIYIFIVTNSKSLTFLPRKVGDPQLLGPNLLFSHWF